MKTTLTLTAAAALLGLSLCVAHAADTNAPSATTPNSGAAIGTPGEENKGNPIAVPPNASTAPVDQGASATDTTPGEQAKGNNKGTPLTSE
jgi:hypothetical protein